MPLSPANDPATDGTTETEKPAFGPFAKHVKGPLTGAAWGGLPAPSNGAWTRD